MAEKHVIFDVANKEAPDSNAAKPAIKRTEMSLTIIAFTFIIYVRIGALKSLFKHL
jgi:hypothetical protein